MIGRRDRAELALLGALLLGWGLAVAPALHHLEHAGGHRHHHGAPARDTSHGEGSLEHQLAVFAPVPVAKPPQIIVVALADQPVAIRPAPSVELERPTAMPQGP